MTAMNVATERNADRMARRATAVGAGLLLLMPAWLVAVRVTALLWDPPVGPTVAMLTAIAICVVAATAVNRRLRRAQRN
jgi:membrane protein implicated in regulation of membrane protease activity